jgi:hypothetical protein
MLSTLKWEKWALSLIILIIANYSGTETEAGAQDTIVLIFALL